MEDSVDLWVDQAVTALRSNAHAFASNFTSHSGSSAITDETPCHNLFLESQALELASSRFQDKLARHIAGLRQEGNARAAHIHRLPVELLAEIFFTSIRATSHSCLDNEHDEEPVVFPFIITRVCSLWYQIGTSTPKLWSLLCSRAGMRQTQALLDRSGSVSLDVVCHTHPNYTFMNLVLPHIPRWRTFASWSDHVLRKGGLGFSMYPAPYLETFAVNGSGSPDSYPDPSRPQRALQLFKGAAPKLQNLRISPSSLFTVPWDSPILSNLNVIRIGDLGGELRQAKYRQLFKSLPLLGQAVIYCTLPDGGRDDQGIPTLDLEPIIHPSLSSLVLKGLPASLVFAILSFLSQNGSYICTLTVINCWSGLLNSPDPVQSSSILCHTLAQLRRLQITSDLDHHGTRIRFQGLTSERSWNHWHAPINDNRRKVLDLEFNRIRHPLSTLMPILFPSTIQFKYLRSLRLIGGSDSLMGASLSNRLPSLLALEELWLENFTCNDSATALDNIFRCLLSPRDNPDIETWACPKLVNVELRDLKLELEGFVLFVLARYRDEGESGRPLKLKQLYIVDCCTVTDPDEARNAINTINQSLTSMTSTRMLQADDCRCRRTSGAHASINTSGDHARQG